MKGPKVTFQWWVFGGALLLALWEMFLEVHVPGTDVFLFKEAGVNLATKGKFVAAFLPHMAFGDEKPFAYYPPVYPFVFGLWTWIWGVGLKQSLLFDSVLTLVRTVLMLQLIVPSLPPSFFEREKRGLRWMAGFFFCLLTLVSTDRDRPDELALVWGLLLCLVLTSAKKNSVKAILSPVLLALVGATSPACGVLFALVLFFWCLGQKNRFRLLLPVGAGTLFCWGLIVLPVLAGDLGSGFRFSKQAGLSTFPYLRDLAASWRWTDLMAVWVRYLGLFWKAGKSYILFAMGTMGMGLGLIARFGRDLNSLQRTCMYSAIAYCVLAPMIWTLQPYYLWFSGVLLLVGVFQMAGKMKPFGQRTVLTACFLFVSPLWFWEFKCVLNALEVPGEERSDEIRKQVLAEIDPSAKLAVTHDQYFTFRKNKEVVNVAYWINEANQFDYLYITDLPDSRRQTPRIRQLLSDELRPCFELVKDFSTHTPFRLMGYQTRHFVRGNGGGLFKNICKNTPQNS